MKLGGWWRIWVVLSLFYSVAVLGLYTVLVVGHSFWPTIDDVRYQPRHAYLLTQQSRDLLDAAPPSVEVLQKELRAAQRMGQQEKASRLADQILLTQAKIESTRAIQLTAPNGQIFRVPASATPEQVAHLQRDLSTILNKDLSSRRSTILWLAAVTLFAPPVFLLLLGLAVGWVRRGFKS